MPTWLSRAAAIVPATCVPWSALAVGAGAVQPSASVKSLAAGFDVALQVRVIGGDLLVDDGDGDPDALRRDLPGLEDVDVGVIGLLERPLRTGKSGRPDR